MSYTDPLEQLSYDSKPLSISDAIAITRAKPYTIKLTIYIDGQSYKYFEHFELEQSALTHHHFTLIVPHDFMGIPQDHNLNEARHLTGKRLTADFSYNGISDSPMRSFKGIITTLGYLRNDANHYGKIVIKGYSPTILLDAAVHCQSFGGERPTRLAPVVQEVIQDGIDSNSHLCKIRIEPSYTGDISYICQSSETHYNFLARTAAAYGEQFFYDGVTIHFGKLPPPEKAINMTVDQDILDSKINIKLAHVKRQMYGYNSMRHEQLSASETKLDHHQSWLARDAYETSKKTFLTPSITRVPFNASTHKDVAIAQESANKRAASTLLTVKGHTKMPFLNPGCLINVQMLKNDGESYHFACVRVVEVAHRITPQGEYDGYFKAIGIDTDSLPTPVFETPILAGGQEATVIENMDAMGRVRVRFDWQMNGQSSGWMPVLSPDAGSSAAVPKNRGFVAIPELGDRVMVKFMHGSPDEPFVAGGVFTGKTGAGGGPNNNIKSWTSKSGHQLMLDDGGGITIKDKTGKNLIHIDGEKKITLLAAKTIKITNGQASIIIDDGKISILADKIVFAGINGQPAKKIDISGLETTLKGTNSVKIQSDHQVILSSKGTTHVDSAKELTIASENTTIRSKAITNIKGSVVNLIGAGGATQVNQRGQAQTETNNNKPLHVWEQPSAVQDATRVSPPINPEDKKVREGKPENAVLFVNGYRFRSNPMENLQPALEHANSDNAITKGDRHSYWEGVDNQFSKQLNAGSVFYADGHHSIETSNHRTMASFTRSSTSMLPRLPQVPAKSQLSAFASAASLPIGVAPTNTGQLMRSIQNLNTESNKAGFQQRRLSGQKAAQALLVKLKDAQAHADKYNQPPIKVLDIVAHSMGYAYALGMVDILKGKVAIGRLYIIAPENAIAGDINLNDFEEVWQYGANLGEPNADPLHMQDGVAPQTAVKGIQELEKKNSGKHGRAFIPKSEPKGFLKSHSIGNYKWIFKRGKQETGYVKSRD